MLAAEEERFTRKKHDASFPRRAIEFCLEPGPVDYVAFYENPKVKFNRVLTTAAAMGKPARDAFVHSMRAWLTERHGITGRLASLAGVPRDRVVFADHHLSHAASAYFPSEFDSAAVITVDGVGEWATATIGRAASGDGGHRLEIEGQVDFPHSLGLFYSAFTDFLGFEVNEGEYKVMGMAPYGEPRFVDELSRVLRTYEDGSFWLDSTTSRSTTRRARPTPTRCTQLLGTGPRKRDEPFSSRGEERSQRLRRHRRQRPGGDRARDRQPRARRARAHRLDEPLLRGRRGAERDGEPPDPRGDRDRAALHPAGARRLRGALGAALYVEHVVLGRRSERVRSSTPTGAPRYSTARDRRGARGRPRASSTASCPTRRRLLADDGRRARRRRGRRLVPGPLRVRPARARQPQHPRRPAPGRDEGADQREDQVPRALPPVRAGGRGGARRHAAAARAARTSTPPASCS